MRPDEKSWKLFFRGKNRRSYQRGYKYPEKRKHLQTRSTKLRIQGVL